MTRRREAGGLRRRAPRATLLAALALLASTGCARPRPWPVRVVLSLQGAAGRAIHGMDLTVALPAGARLRQDPATRHVARAALATLAGATAATLDATATPHPTAPHVRILLASREPMRDGEVASVELDVDSPIAPPRERFEVVRAVVSGPGGATVNGATGWVSAVEGR